MCVDTWQVYCLNLCICHVSTHMYISTCTCGYQKFCLEKWQIEQSEFLTVYMYLYIHTCRYISKDSLATGQVDYLNKIRNFLSVEMFLYIHMCRYISRLS